MELKKFSKFIVLSLGLKILSVFFGLYTNRWVNTLDKAVLADYNQILSLTSIVLAIVIFGVPTLIQKNFTNDDNIDRRNEIWTISGLIRFVSYFIGLALLFFALPYTAIKDASLAYILYSIQFLLLIDNNYRAVSDSKGTTWKFSLTDLITKSLLVALLIFSQYFRPRDMGVFLLSLAISYTVGLIIDYFIFKNDVKIVRIKDLSQFKPIVKTIFFTSLTGIIASIYSGIDVLILGRLSFDESTIIGYSNGYKIFTLLLIIPTFIAPPLSTLIKKRYDKGNNNFLISRIFKNLAKPKSFKIYLLEWLLVSILGGFLISISIYFLSPFLIWLIDPDLRFPIAVDTLKILGFSFIFIFPTHILNFILLFFNQEHKEFFAIFLVTLISIVGYLLLIPALGAIGASIATLTYLCVDFLVKLVIMFRLTKT